MQPYLLILLLLPHLLSCTGGGEPKDNEKAYDMLMRVGEMNASGNKQGAVALADSALAMNPADTTRCWLLSEKTVALVDMGRMADAVGVARQAYDLAQQLDDEEAMFNLRGTMGIDNAQSSGRADNVWYDLQGRRITAPTAHGIYIVNGKKVMR